MASVLISEVGRGVSADDFRFILANIAKLVRQRRREVIAVASVEHADLTINRQLNRPPRNQPALLAFRVHNRLFPRTRARRVLLAQKAHLPTRHRSANQQQPQPMTPKIRLFIGAEYVLMLTRRLVEGEEIRQG